MNRLVLAFGIVCLLQGFSAEPNPSFSLTNELALTGSIKLVRFDAKSTSDAIAGYSVPTILSGYTGLTSLKTQIEAVISNFGSKLKTVITAYGTLITATDGNVITEFDDFTNAISLTSSYISNDVPTITDALNQLGYYGISDQLKDAFDRTASVLDDLKAKATTLKGGIQAALFTSTSSTIDAASLRQNVPLSKVYDLLRASRNLSAYLPLVKYILITTILTISEADNYLGQLKTALSTTTPAEAAKFTTDINTLLTSIKTQVSSDFDSENTSAGNAVTAIGQLTTIMGTAKYTALTAVTSTLNNLFKVSTLQTQTDAMKTAFDHISTAVDALLAQLKATVNVVTDPTVKLLIDTLLGDDEYGRYCFEKYRYLVSGLFGQSFDSAYLCADKEYGRLDYLSGTLELIVDLMSADYEDIQEQVTVCSNVAVGSTNQEKCVEMMATYYAAVYAATADKIAALYTFATDEAVASENRLLICLQLVYFEGSVLSAEKISTDLKNCAVDGPAGTKE